jgi:hypothetical protein
VGLPGLWRAGMKNDNGRITVTHGTSDLLSAVGAFHEMPHS